jgi:hypothetical protein
MGPKENIEISIEITVKLKKQYTYIINLTLPVNRQCGSPRPIFRFSFYSYIFNLLYQDKQFKMFMCGGQKRPKNVEKYMINLKISNCKSQNQK